jgi:hypothetical protein
VLGLYPESPMALHQRAVDAIVFPTMARAADTTSI